MTYPTPTNDNLHDDVRILLPWYVTDRLDPDERVRVEDHIARCASCVAELERERIAARRIADAPLDIDSGWQRLRERIAAPAGSDEGRVIPLARAPRWPRVAAFAIAAQFAAIAIGIGALTHYAPSSAPATSGYYHVLGSDAAMPRGNILLMVDGRTSTAALAEMVGSSRARIVDGPTVTGAYVLAVDEARRDAAIARLKKDPAATVVEAIDL